MHEQRRGAKPKILHNLSALRLLFIDSGNVQSPKQERQVTDAWVHVLLIVNALALTSTAMFFPHATASVEFVKDLSGMWTAALAVIGGAAAATALQSRVRAGIMEFLKTKNGICILCVLFLFLSFFGLLGIFHGGGTIVEIAKITAQERDAGSSSLATKAAMQQLSDEMRTDIAYIINDEFTGRPIKSVAGEFGSQQFFKVTTACTSVLCTTLKHKRRTIRIEGSLGASEGFLRASFRIWEESMFFEKIELPGINIRRRTSSEIMYAVVDRIRRALDRRQRNVEPDDWDKPMTRSEKNYIWTAMDEHAEEILSTGSSLEEAITKFEAALKTEPKPEYYYYLGVAYLNSGRPDDAEQFLKKAVDATPALRNRVRFQVAKRLFLLGEFERARQAWRDYLRLEPNDTRAVARFGMATWRAAKKLSETPPMKQFTRTNFQQQVEEAERILLSANDDGVANYVLAQLYSKLGEFSESDNLYKRALETAGEKEHDIVARGYATSLRERANFDAAVYYFKESIKRASKAQKNTTNNFASVEIDGETFFLNVDNLYFSDIDSLLGYYFASIEKALSLGEEVSVANTVQATIRQLLGLVGNLDDRTPLRGSHVLEVKADVYDLLGYALMLNGNLSEAGRYLRRAQELERKSGYIYKEPHISLHNAQWLIRSAANGSKVNAEDIKTNLELARALSISGSWTEKNILNAVADSTSVQR